MSDKNKNTDNNKALHIASVSISFNMPDDATLEFKEGTIEVEGEVRTEGFADNEWFANGLNKEQTKKLYETMKAYYNEC